MASIPYSNDSLLRYTTLKAMEREYQNLKEKTQEIKPQLTRKAYRKLKARSSTEELTALVEKLQAKSDIQLDSYIAGIDRQDIPNEIKRMDDELKKIRKVYLELTAIEAKLSGYPFKEKYVKKSVEVKEIIGEKQKKEEELRALCGTSRPFTKTGRTKLNSTAKKSKEDHSVRNSGIEPKPVTLIPRNDIWVHYQDKHYKKEIETYSRYIKNHKFTKITDETLQENLLVACINNENPKLVPLEKNFALMARTYQNLYDDCLNIDKELLSVPEVRSKIQKHIINYFNDNMKHHPTYDKDSTRWKWFRRPNTHHQLYFNDMRYMDDLLRLLLNERRGYTELRDSTHKLLQKNEKQIKSQIAELKQELKPVAYSKFKKNFQGFDDLIQQVKKHPYLGLKPFLNDILEKNKDLLEQKMWQIKQYKGKAVMLYREKKELETALEIFSYGNGDIEYNYKKMQAEKKLKALCGTTSPLTEKGKQMIAIRSDEEDLHTYNNLNYILSEWKFPATDRRPLRAILMEAEHRDRWPIERKDSGKKRVEPEEDITHM